MCDRGHSNKENLLIIYKMKSITHSVRREVSCDKETLVLTQAKYLTLLR